ncbi:MAG: hypothetical protein JW955_18345 [Sedimentisphaerales bacterium]|nr:hypothetical protein [Sedimentisphaerales bacterium]
MSVTVAGGRPQMAQAGGKDPTRIDEALAKATELIKASLDGSVQRFRPSGVCSFGVSKSHHRDESSVCVAAAGP